MNQGPKVTIVLKRLNSIRSSEGVCDLLSCQCNICIQIKNKIIALKTLWWSKGFVLHLHARQRWGSSVKNVVVFFLHFLRIFTVHLLVYLRVRDCIRFLCLFHPFPLLLGHWSQFSNLSLLCFRFQIFEN